MLNQNIILSICVIIFIYLLLNTFKFNYETFDFYNFKCISDESYIYIRNIKNIKKNLQNDRLLISKPYECNKLLDLYDILLCDLKKNDINLLEITELIEIDTNYDNKIAYINTIFEKLVLKSEDIINNISKLSVDVTNERYLTPNKIIFENIKTEFIMKLI